MGTNFVVEVQRESSNGGEFINLDDAMYLLFCCVFFIKNMYLFYIHSNNEGKSKFKLQSTKIVNTNEQETVLEAYHFNLKYNTRNVKYEFALVKRGGMIFLTDQGRTYKMLDDVFDLAESDVRKNLTAIMNNLQIMQEGNEFLIKINTWDENSKTEGNVDINEAKHRLLECVSFMDAMRIFYV